jgi:hypothetical protein
MFNLSIVLLREDSQVLLHIRLYFLSKVKNNKRLFFFLSFFLSPSPSLSLFEIWLIFVFFGCVVVKTRLSVSEKGVYRNITDAFIKIAKTEGYFRPFYRGLTPSLVSTIPSSGTNLTVYETLKKGWFSEHSSIITCFELLSDVMRIGLLKYTGDKEPKVWMLLTCSTISSTCGQLVSYPLHVFKSRLVAQVLFLVHFQLIHWIGVSSKICWVSTKQSFMLFFLCLMIDRVLREFPNNTMDWLMSLWKRQWRKDCLDSIEEYYLLWWKQFLQTGSFIQLTNWQNVS